MLCRGVSVYASASKRAGDCGVLEGCWLVRIVAQAPALAFVSAERPLQVFTYALKSSRKEVCRRVWLPTHARAHLSPRLGPLKCSRNRLSFHIRKCECVCEWE